VLEVTWKNPTIGGDDVYRCGWRLSVIFVLLHYKNSAVTGFQEQEARWFREGITCRDKENVKYVAFRF